MTEGNSSTLLVQLMEGLGALGAVIFYGRFYIQWIVSEIKKKSVVPVVFWYMSSIGCLILFVYGVYRQSPLGTLSQTFNLIVYVRNLVHIQRARGALSKRTNTMLHGIVGMLVLIALGITIHIWLREYQSSQQITRHEAQMTWLWLGLGVIGQGLFACRFLIQWLATEYQKRSVMPPIFWYISILASLLMMPTFFQRHEWPYAIGLPTTTLIYIRNIWFIYHVKDTATSPQESAKGKAHGINEK